VYSDVKRVNRVINVVLWLRRLSHGTCTLSSTVSLLGGVYGKGLVNKEGLRRHENRCILVGGVNKVIVVQPAGLHSNHAFQLVRTTWIVKTTYSEDYMNSWKYRRIRISGEVWFRCNGPSEFKACIELRAPLNCMWKNKKARGLPKFSLSRILRLASMACGGELNTPIRRLYHFESFHCVTQDAATEGPRTTVFSPLHLPLPRSTL
jgi:hypothetical protein